MLTNISTDWVYGHNPETQEKLEAVVANFQFGAGEAPHAE